MNGAGEMLAFSAADFEDFLQPRPDMPAAMEADQHLWLAANYTHFFAGRFLHDTGPGKDIDYATAWVQYRF